MKCKECGSLYKGYWASAPEAYVCVDVKEPFEVVDIDEECIKDQYEPAKRGRWIICCDGYYPYCSECGCEPDSGKLEEICPKCGARMGGESDA